MAYMPLVNGFRRTHELWKIEETEIQNYLNVVDISMEHGEQGSDQSPSRRKLSPKSRNNGRHPYNAKAQDYKIWAEAAFVLSQKVKSKQAFLEWRNEVNFSFWRKMRIWRLNLKRFSRILRSFFEAWRWQISMIRRVMGVDRRSLGRIIKKYQRRTFDWWIRYLVRRRHRNFTSFTAVARWMRAMKTGVFQIWCLKLKRTLSLKRMIVYCSERMVRSVVYEWSMRAFRGVRRKLTQARLQRNLIDKSNSFSNWRVAYKLALKQTKCQELIMCVLSKDSTLNWVDDCFQNWKDFIKDNTHERELLFSMRGCAMMSALCTWRLNVERQRLVQACVQISKEHAEHNRSRKAYSSDKMHFRMGLKRLSAIVAGWRELAVGCARMRQVLRNLAGEHHLRVRAAAWTRWRAGASPPRMLEVAERACAHKARIRDAAGALRTWSRHVDKERGLLQLDTLLGSKAALRACATSLGVWKGAAAMSRLKRSVRRRRHRRLLWRLVRGWRAVGAAWREQVWQAGAMRQEHEGRVAAWAWEAWVCRAGEKSRLQQALHILHLRSTLRV